MTPNDKDNKNKNDNPRMILLGWFLLELFDQVFNIVDELTGFRTSPSKFLFLSREKVFQLVKKKVNQTLVRLVQLVKFEFTIVNLKFNVFTSVELPVCLGLLKRLNDVVDFGNKFLGFG